MLAHARKNFGARTSKFTSENAKKQRFARFFDRNSRVLECARAKIFSRAHQHDVEEKFGEKIFVATTKCNNPSYFHLPANLLFFVAATKIVAKKIFNNIEKILV